MKFAWEGALLALVVILAGRDVYEWTFFKIINCKIRELTKHLNK